MTKNSPGDPELVYFSTIVCDTTPLELRKKPSYFPLYWLVFRDPDIGLLKSPYNWVVFHPLYQPKRPGALFFIAATCSNLVRSVYLNARPNPGGLILPSKSLLTTPRWALPDPPLDVLRMKIPWSESWCGGHGWCIRMKKCNKQKKLLRYDGYRLDFISKKMYWIDCKPIISLLGIFLSRNQKQNHQARTTF